MTDELPKRVHIEFQRVQTWLFAVPRLRAMVGANALLGETLRVALPKLARETGCGWVLAPSKEVHVYPCADENDPLKEHDNPAADAADGILSRDGGHFEAQFASGADAFAGAAGDLLRSTLPRLRFRISIDEKPHTKSQAYLSTELPVFTPCEWTGRGLASAVAAQGDKSDEDYEEREVSRNVKLRHEAAKRAEMWDAQDLATLLAATTKLRELDREKTKELKALVGEGYLAVIHADGNNVGNNKPDDKAEAAKFFHHNRVLLRQAVKTAIDVSCENDAPNRDESRTPLIPLMLGGDDLLVVCRARVALPFVVALCDALAALQNDNDGLKKLTLGVGVVLAHHMIPIHRLHEVAEQLAGSAKRRFRTMKQAGNERSVVDWAVYTSTWLDDPEEVRRRDWVRGTNSDLRVLSQRPIDVLGDGLDTLGGLVSAAKAIEEAKPPRSQLRYLVEQLPRGRTLSELAFAELSKQASDALAVIREKGLWWRVSSDGPWQTALLDLVEILEIGRLGSAAMAAPAEQRPTYAQEA